jgi:hypothetical protein
MNDLKALIKQFMPFAQEKMGFDRPPKLFLKQDTENAANPLGKTGFYDPESESITLYTTDRHPKDIMRSLAHELQHHTQKCNGKFDNTQGMGEQGYAQNDSHLRSMEIEAYQASIVFRDWEDSIKGTIYNEHLQKGVKSSMSTKDWKNGEINTLLTEKWGFSFSLDKLNENEEKDQRAARKQRKDREDHQRKIREGDDEDEEKDMTAARKQRKDREDHQRKIREEDEQVDEASKTANRRVGRDTGGRRVKRGEVAEGDTGASKGDKGKDPDDPEARDYEHGGDRKGDDSKTHKGKDYMNEDSGEEEGEHYEHNAMNDDDHIRAIEHHLEALKKDRDYDDEHIDEARKLQEVKARKIARSLVQRLKEMKKNG